MNFLVKPFDPGVFFMERFQLSVIVLCICQNNVIYIILYIVKHIQRYLWQGIGLYDCGDWARPLEGRLECLGRS